MAYSGDKIVNNRAFCCEYPVNCAPKTLRIQGQQLSLAYFNGSGKIRQIMSRHIYSKKIKSVTFGQWLRTLREDMDLPLRAAAAAADMDQASLSKAELGQRLLTKEQVGKLAKLYKVNKTNAEARLMVEKFRQAEEKNPAAARHALMLLAEEAGIYSVERK